MSESSLPDHPIYISGLEPGAVMELTRQWEERFPGKGQAIMELLGPFYSRWFSFELESPRHDLEARCRAAVFWRNIEGVVVLNGWTSLRDALSVSLGDSLVESFEGGVHDGRIVDLVGDGIVETLGDRLVDAFLESLSRSVQAHIRDSLLGRSREAFSRGNLGSWFWSWLWAWIQLKLIPSSLHVMRYKLATATWGKSASSVFESLVACLVSAVAFRVAGGDRENFEPLLALWRSGNLPAGFDRDGQLLVLCATP